MSRAPLDALIGRLNDSLVQVGCTVTVEGATVKANVTTQNGAVGINFEVSCGGVYAAAKLYVATARTPSHTSCSSALHSCPRPRWFPPAPLLVGVRVGGQSAHGEDCAGSR